MPGRLGSDADIPVGMQHGTRSALPRFSGEPSDAAAPLAGVRSGLVCRWPRRAARGRRWCGDRAQRAGGPRDLGCDRHDAQRNAGARPAHDHDADDRRAHHNRSTGDDRDQFDDDVNDEEDDPW